MVKVLSGSSQPRSLVQFIRGTGLYINKPARIHLPRLLGSPFFVPSLFQPSKGDLGQFGPL